jgi:hypothetical protein
MNDTGNPIADAVLELQMMREARDVEAGKYLTKDRKETRRDYERGGLRSSR